jgi:hypothetical protein
MDMMKKYVKQKVVHWVIMSIWQYLNVKLVQMVSLAPVNYVLLHLQWVCVWPTDIALLVIGCTLPAGLALQLHAAENVWWPRHHLFMEHKNHAMVKAVREYKQLIWLFHLVHQVLIFLVMLVIVVCQVL